MFKGDLREFLKYYVPGRYPKWLLIDYDQKFFGANIDDPSALLSRISVVSIAVSIIIAIGTFILILNIFNNIIVASTLSIFNYVFLTPQIYSFILRMYISYVFSVRKEKIDKDMYPLIVTFLGFARGNLPLLECIKEITKSELGEEIKDEFRKIYSLVAYGGRSLRTAILEVALSTPSGELAEFLRDLSGVSEATRDLVAYLENRLTTYNITRTIALNEYLEKLRIYSEVYLLLSTLLCVSIIVLGLFRLSSAGVSTLHLQLIVFTIFPGMTLLLILAIHSASPEKDYRRKYSDLSSALIGVVFIAMFISLLLNAFVGIDYRLNTLIALTVLSCLILPIVESRIKFENGFDNELIIFTNRLIALLESRPMARSLQAIRLDEFYYIKDHIKNMIVLSSRGDPLTKVFDWLHKNAPTIMSKTFALVVSRAILSTSKIIDVMQHLIREFHSYQHYKQTRSSITRTIGGVLLICFVLICVILIMINTYFLPTLTTNISPQNTQIYPTITLISEQTVRQSKDVSISIMLILLIVTPLGISAIDGDVRKYFRYFLPLAIISIVVYYIISIDINLFNLFIR